MTTFRAYIALVELPERARRIRAAMAYGGYKSRKALSKDVEISPSTLQRIEGVAEPTRPPKRSELLAIAEACEVPMRFLEEGWDGWQAKGKLSPGDEKLARKGIAELDKLKDSDTRKRGGAER